MIELDDAQNKINYLVDALKPLIQGKITHSYVNNSLYKHLGPTAICIAIEYIDTNNIRCVLSADINSKGELYNPIFMPNMLTYVFDWINLLGYDKSRIINRTEKYKEDILYFGK